MIPEMDRPENTIQNLYIEIKSIIIFPQARKTNAFSFVKAFIDLSKIENKKKRNQNIWGE